MMVVVMMMVMVVMLGADEAPTVKKLTTHGLSQEVPRPW